VPPRCITRSHPLFLFFALADPFSFGLLCFSPYSDSPLAERIVGRERSPLSSASFPWVGLRWHLTTTPLFFFDGQNFAPPPGSPLFFTLLWPCLPFLRIGLVSPPRLWLYKALFLVEWRIRKFSPYPLPFFLFACSLDFFLRLMFSLLVPVFVFNLQTG